jgi:tetraacyldisaccharide 4'-kinase
MRAPEFWWRRERSPAASLLAPLSALAGAYASARLKREGRDVGIPVICVGNPTVGGSGKTPTAIHLAHRLSGLGRRAVFLTRGYGGSLRGPVIVDPNRHTSAEVGDEPLLLARAAPVIVGRDRVVAALGAERLGAEALVMDDGFQNPALSKSLSILVVDAAVGVGNGLVLPAGPLRAPLAPQFERADALLLIGNGVPGEEIGARAASAGLPVLHARLAPEAGAAARLIGQRLYAFAGIGRPAKFFATLDAIGLRPAKTRAFADHHVFTEAEIETLLREADIGGFTLVTTEKDAARLAASAQGRVLLRTTEVLPVRLVPDEASGHELERLLAKALTPARAV